MVRSRGPVWHQKYKKAGYIPSHLHGVDREATWSYSEHDQWIYGHGTFCITTHDIPVVGIFKWMRNSSHEHKKMRQVVWNHRDQLKYICMDKKADSQELYFYFKKSGVQLLTAPRKVLNKTAKRRQMIKELQKRSFRQEYKKRSVTVEPMQGLIGAIFELERCWMVGDDSNKWVFAAMGVALQMAQLRAYRLGRSTWSVRQEVLGL
jgi:hypothetical protein